MASIDQLLVDARRGLNRLTPVQAAAAVQHGALLIDTRSSEQRRSDGEVPGAIVIERNFLEWRLDPTSPDRIPQLSDRAGESLVIIMCNQGYSSSLAAATLQRLGLRHVTDVIGGFQGWADSGFPVREAPSHQASLIGICCYEIFGSRVQTGTYRHSVARCGRRK